MTAGAIALGAVLFPGHSSDPGTARSAHPTVIVSDGTGHREVTLPHPSTAPRTGVVTHEVAPSRATVVGRALPNRIAVGNHEFSIEGGVISHRDATTHRETCYTLPNRVSPVGLLASHGIVFAVTSGATPGTNGLYVLRNDGTSSQLSNRLHTVVQAGQEIYGLSPNGELFVVRQGALQRKMSGVTSIAAGNDGMLTIQRIGGGTSHIVPETGAVINGPSSSVPGALHVDPRPGRTTYYFD